MGYIDSLLKSEDLVSPGISACQGCAAELNLRMVLKTLGKNTILAIPPGCMAGAGCTGWNYSNGLKIPVHITLLGNTACVLSGIKNMYETKGKEVNVVAFAGDGATADCGFQSLSGAAERSENIIYICYDNEGYMNTGFQRSSTTSKGSNTSTTPIGKLSSGKKQHKKDMPLIMAMHNCAYMATLSPAYPKDFIRKIQKAKDVKNGLSYLHILSPCPTGWKFKPNMTIEVARKAVQTNFFPLFEIENSILTINSKIKKPLPISSFVKLLGKFGHLKNEEIIEIQDWCNKRYAYILSLSEHED